ncbi:MAG: hypothetical protein A2Y37_10290 [Spirochaetes bacterium GWB1_60_80]|nr:MAG: hypothetical protein A2Y37_10290 [Spirochaetes bacterium GWB1_60_80]OHD43439.1 MAG: hypothetical protein A2Y35_11660 [Spirochaetes bacterium GWE1_60_18]OHD58970.1 MAG: hypothetical protein A2Y32_10450 [Spirochaetes bacterium GWF1_60_12]
MDYGNLYALPPLSHFMRPVSDPIVALGPVLQIFRGLVLALVFWFFQQQLFRDKGGLPKLMLLVAGLSYLSAIGPAPGSLEGYIFTTFPLSIHLLGLPEFAIYLLSFSFLLNRWQKTGSRKLTFIMSIALALLVGMNLLGFLQAAASA